MPATSLSFDFAHPEPAAVDYGLNVVYQAIQLALRIQLGLASQVKPHEPLVVLQVRKHRLHGAQTLAIKLLKVW